MDESPAGNRWWIALLLLALGLRLVVWFGALQDPQRFVRPDSQAYLELAESLAAERTFAREGEPEVRRVPGYPAFVAAVSGGTLSVAAVCFVQVLLDVAVCFLVWCLAKRLFGPAAAWPALVFQALSVASIVYANQLLSETVFTVLFVGLLTVLVGGCAANERFAEEGARPFLGAAAAGGLLGIMTVVRAVALPFSLLAAAFVWWRAGWRRAIGLVATLVLVLAPWVIRNIAVADYAGFSTAGAIVLYRYNACMLEADRREASFAEVQAEFSKRLNRYENQVSRAEFASREARRILLAHPVRYLFLHASTVPTNLLPAAGQLLELFGVRVGGAGTLRVVREEGVLAGVRHYFAGQWQWFPVAVVAAGITLLTYALAAAGVLAWLVRRRDLPVLLLMAAAATYFLVVPGAAAHPRFRVPAMPIVAVFAGVGWKWAADWRAQRSRTPDSPS